ncbi:hypothetical protein PPL_02710 [Heterostelium album PN500]|uniref:Uncharacterized protein n=1 Tax=Heterostelium pallidum (strain ATCC 26659 / Pp 5 / PN500) TaxID=670386 RepID=D3B2U6_HETP5|nr:hypothetical protein PPL_02710 [Heterostelium album PN500]EFA83644.1 hypothetical protein PPL_02710 [Heterostelium album PN500]|eukprot:XP_020435761.1 hypothetical protein PPL_02710 [Heterostelium album PN500]
MSESNNNNNNISIEDELKQYIESLQFPFPYRFGIEYYKLMRDSQLESAVRPLVIIGVDRTLSPQERSLVPSNYNGVRIQMEYTQIIDVDARLQSAVAARSATDPIDKLIVESEMNEDDEDEDEDDEDCEEDEMDQ